MGKRGRKKKKLLILGGIVWVILIAALAIWALFDEYRSDPLAPRPWAEPVWNAEMVEAKPPAEHPIALSGIKVSPKNANEIEVAYPLEMPGVAPRSVVVAGPDDLNSKLNENLSIRLAQLAVGFASGPDEAVPRGFEADSLAPLKPEKFRQQLLPWFGEDDAPELEDFAPPKSGKTEFHFFVTADSKDGPIVFSDFTLFDPATRNAWRALTWESALSFDEHRRYGVRVPFQLYRFHDRPLRLTAEIVHGPPELISVAPTVGALGIGEQFVCQLLEMREARSVSIRWANSGGSEKVDVRFEGAEGSGVVILLGFSGASPQTQRSIFVETRDGKRLSAPVRGWKLAWARIPKITPRDIASIEVEAPKHKLAVFDLPRIPGMPEANSSPSNLFSVEAPYLNIRDKTDLQQLLRDAAQFDGWVESPELPDDWFPRVYRRKTIRSVVADYLSEVRQPHYFDRARFVLTETDKPGWRIWLNEKWEGVKDWF